MIVAPLDADRWRQLDGRALEQAAREDLHDPSFVVADELGRRSVRAWVALQEHHAQGLILASFLTDEVEIVSVVVSPSARRRGLGRLLVDAVLDAARGAGMRVALLEVRRANAAAIALYERAGFRSYGVRRGYYRSPPDDALQLVAEIEPGAAEPFFVG